MTDPGISGLLLPALAACAAAGTAVVARRRARRAEAAAAERWEWIRRQREILRPQGVYLVQAVHVYQRARRGSKAQVRWCDTGALQDAWFWGWHVPPGAYVLVKGGIGFGPHNRNPKVLYVEQSGLYGWTSAQSARAWERRSTRKA